MRITRIDTHVLLDPGYDQEATSSAQDDVVVEIHTDEGLIGIGETDLNAWVARALIEAPGTHTMDRGLADQLIGEDPLDDMLWERLYVSTAMTGRRGAGIHALGALDMALWDLRGKAAGVPVHRLIGPQREAVRAYASLMPEVETFEEFEPAMVQLVLDARALGFGAAKLELIFDGPYRNFGVTATDDQVTGVLAAVREAVGSDFTLMVDVGYAWDSVDRALGILRDWEPYNLYFVETPLWSDDLDGYAALARSAPTRIAAGEWLATRFEFAELMDRGLVAVAQPDMGRVGGLTEAVRVSRMAAEREREVIPHAWKTGISVAAAAQLATATPNCPYFEFLPGSLAVSALRRDLVDDEVRLVDGLMTIPERAGLGIELNRDAVERFAEAARELEQRRREEAVR